MTLKECKCGRKVFTVPCSICARRAKAALINRLRSQVRGLQASNANLKTINKKLRGMA